MGTEHIDDDQATRVLTGDLDGAERSHIEEHADRCAACRRLLTELARRSAAIAEDDAPLLAAGTSVGRYVVEGVVGAGAMGIVYSATDPQLGRRVALKLLRPRQGASDRGRARLLAEAQALAKLSHPNVVQVYDAGEWSGRVFVALELVRGGTLGDWLAAQRRAPTEILLAFGAAGAGLEAAHRARIIHRDVKPDNILVGEDGRVRVTDFGLASGSGEARDGEALPAAAASHASLETESGVVLGTPKYMAPEQRRGERADERSDQYSFAVALDEALQGARVPSRVRRAIDRALSESPAERHASMAALVAELAWDPKDARRRWITGIASLALIAITALAIARARSHDAMCALGDGRFDRVLSPARREKLDAILQSHAADGGPLAAERAARAARFRAELDGYRRDWVAVYRDSCEATRVRGDQSEEVLELKMACLESRLAGVDVMASLLERDDPAVDEDLATRAVLEPLGSCSDRSALLEPDRRPKDPGARAAIDELAKQISRVYALDRAGRFKDAHQQAGPLVARAREVAYGPALASALRIAAQTEEHASALADAERDYTESALVGEASRDDRDVAVARVSLVYVVGVERGRPADAHRLLDEAAAAIGRLGGDARLEADLVSKRGEIAEKEGKRAEARELLEQAIVMARKAYGPDTIDEARAENLLAVFLSQSPTPADAVPHYRRALELDERLLGPHHPYALLQRSNLAAVLVTTARVPEAREEVKTLLALTEAAVGPDHAQTANALLLYGGVLSYDRATRADAPAMGARAVEILDKLYPGGSDDVAAARAQLGEMLVDDHRFAEAEAALVPALEMFERGKNDAGLLMALELHAEALIGLGKLDRAAEELERAMHLAAASDLDARRVATLDFALARAIAAKDRKRAKALATEARAKFETDTFPDDERLDAVKAWLVAHPR